MTDDAETLEALIGGGSDPAETYREAMRRGLPQVEAVRLLRGGYGLTLDEAKAVAWSVDGYPSYILPPIRNYDELVGVLAKDLGYCGCSHAVAAIEVLRDTLRITKTRFDSLAAEDVDATWRKAGEDLTNVLNPETAPGLATWFLYLLDDRGFVEHAGNVSSCWSTRKGVQLLEAIEAFYPPLPPPDDEDSIDQGSDEVS